MSEQDASTTGTTSTTDAATTDQGASGGSTYTPPATQADLDRIVEARVARTKNQFKDYATFKAAADELAQLKAADQTELERATAEATRWQTEASTWRDAAIGSRVETLASSDFADPTDALGALGGDLTRFFDADGQIDDAKIRAELSAVLERKPHWRKADTTAQQPFPRLPAANFAQGRSGAPTTADPATEFGAAIQRQLGLG